MKQIIDKCFVMVSLVIVGLSFVFSGGLPFDQTEKNSQL